jgi:hypothetical protein
METIARLNIQRFRKLLAQEIDATMRRTVLRCSRKKKKNSGDGNRNQQGRESAPRVSPLAPASAWEIVRSAPLVAASIHPPRTRQRATRAQVVRQRSVFQLGEQRVWLGEPATAGWRE